VSCRYCDGFGLVEVVEPEGGYAAAVGPCPKCPKGRRLEFSKGGPWGQEGFWRGRDHSWLKPQKETA
jgi:hypothetical protein